MADHRPENTEIPTTDGKQKPQQFSTEPEQTSFITSDSHIANVPESPGVAWFREHSIPIAGLILLALLLCLVGHYSSVTIDWSRTKDFSEVLQNFVQVAAFGIAGWWAYFKFIKGRTFKESLIPAVSGKLTTVNDRTYLIANIRVKNVGQSIVEFAPNASSLKLFGYSVSTTGEIVTVADYKLTQFEALHESDAFIEPNEIINGTRFIAIPGSVELGFRLEVEIISSRGSTWRSASVVEKSSVGVNIVPESITLEGS